MFESIVPTELQSLFEGHMGTYNRGYRNLGAMRDEIARAVRDERPHAFWAVDVGAPLVVAALWVLLPFEVSTLGRIVGAVVIASVGWCDLLLRNRLPADWSHTALHLLRLVAAYALAAASPVVWHAAAVICGILLVASVPMQARKRSYFAVALTVFVLSGIALWRGVPSWYLSIAILAIGTIGSENAYRIWQEERTEIDRRHDEVLDRARIFSWEVDAASGTILGMAGNVEAVLGYNIEELVGESVLTLVDAQEAWQVPDTYEVNDDEAHRSVRVKHRDGHVVVLREVRLENGGDVLRGVSIDMTELAHANEALRHQAEHDSLTGLANRECLRSTIGELLEEDPTREVAVIIADLDRFKEVNDTLGHPVGDRLLRRLAHTFAARLPDADIVARIGGDEFAFGVWGDNVDTRAKELARQIHLVAASPIEVDGLKLAVACSVGVACAPNHGSTYSDLLKHADIALYQSKRSGGGVRVFESTPQALSIQRLQLLSEIGEAIERGEFELHMQPQVDLTTGSIVGVEGLARWRHPEYGLLLPGAFLHTIEVAADYRRFTSEMVRQAVDFAAKAAAAGHRVNVAVNLGSMSFLDQSFPVRLRELLASRRLPASALTLEVTESDIVDADAPVFDALKGLGMRLSIDDFGTGYSSLTRLRAISVEEVKIDQAFVAGLGVEAEDAIIVRAVMELCRLLGHDVVAEGVETRTQMEMLQRYGCRTAQGWLFARAMPQHELLEKLERGISYNVGRPRNIMPRSSISHSAN